ncbi:MAG: Abi family protein [Geobacteraceae bacterium]|nr:Abi family protein [Geobacteraceae bacterium]
MKISFTKPATTHSEQVTLLQQRGMIVDDISEAAFYLQHINYYRLGAYWLPFELDHATHQIKPGTRFSDVLNLYIFDREFRLLVLDAIERIEVSARSQWAYYMAHNHGPHSHLDSSLAYKLEHWKKNLSKLIEEVKRSEETFIQHMTATYSEVLPPVWAACEVMSLGLLSRWYNALKPMKTRSAIAAVYGIDQRSLQSWLHHLSFVRNLCAHHSRLWNRKFSIIPDAPKNKPAPLAQEFISSRKIYNTCLILLHCLDQIAPGHHWRGRFKALVTNHNINTRMMDFPQDWQQRPAWKEVQP